MAVLIVSKNHLLRDALCTCCAQRNISVRFSCSMIEDIEKMRKNDLVLLHTVDPAVQVQQGLARLRTMAADLRIILLTPEETTEELRESLSGQVNAIIPDNRSVDALIGALAVVQEGYSLVRTPPRAANGAVPPVANGKVQTKRGSKRAAQDRCLSARENMILSRLTSGDSNKDIANDLGICETTVKVHLRTCYQKIGVKNRTQAAIWAVLHL